jgi:hypothetical protein
MAMVPIHDAIRFYSASKGQQSVWALLARRVGVSPLICVSKLDQVGPLLRHRNGQSCLVLIINIRHQSNCGIYQVLMRRAARVVLLMIHVLRDLSQPILGRRATVLSVLDSLDKPITLAQKVVCRHP